MGRENRQYGPWPDELEALVARIRYRPGWRFSLEDIERDPASSHGAAAGGLTFIVRTMGYDSYHPELGQKYGVYHYFPVPTVTYNRESWQRWLFDQIVRVETHEAMEFFALAQPRQITDEANGPEVLSRPYAATHGPGDDPYVVHDYATDDQRRTQFTGERAE